MNGHPARSVHRALLSFAALACVALLATTFAGRAQAKTVTAGANASPASVASQPPITAGSNYLALGDSVTFGYQEPTTVPPPNYLDPSSLVGFPEDIASDLDVNVNNAACPGETSSSFINDTKQSNGCETQPNGSPGYRALFPLHVTYSRSQMRHAVKYLTKTSNVTLVSLMIGANDFLLCQEQTSDQCSSTMEQDAFLATLRHNLKTILGKIRAVYHGQLVVVDYYSPTSALDSLTEVSDAFENRIASKYHVEIADGFGAFMNAETAAGDSDDPCAAGLLTQLSSGGCGIHPSAAGQTVLAQAVEQVVQTSSSQ
ncbi:MAG TPA: SGNH/GDSL hydrolase family protein [Solirubrobacteraceae bacterium]|jgi:lysophospholipase L1-like esterase